MKSNELRVKFLEFYGLNKHKKMNEIINDFILINNFEVKYYYNNYPIFKNCELNKYFYDLVNTLNEETLEITVYLSNEEDCENEYLNVGEGEI